MPKAYDHQKLVNLSAQQLDSKQLAYILEVLTNESNKHKQFFDDLIETKLTNIPFLYRQAFQEYVDKCNKEVYEQEELLNKFGKLFNQSQTDN